jgi:hypothetical protein
LAISAASLLFDEWGEMVDSMRAGSIAAETRKKDRKRAAKQPFPDVVMIEFRTFF